ncbi:MAG TPA: enoyl-CoA hydratase-related protein [Acidimicrobiia bacterium]
MAVRYEQQGDVAVITLDRPEVYNAIDRRLAFELVEAIERAGEEARAAVVTGAGKAFCAGADLAMFGEAIDTGQLDLATHLVEVFHPVIEGMLDAQVPTIAAINGVVAGAGMGIALASDLRVISTDAYFVSAFIGIGLVPDSGSTWFLPQLVGLSRAMDLTLTNRRVPADEALRIGLVHRLEESDDLLARALEWAGELADGPTTAYVATRKLLRDAAGSDFATALRAEKEMQGLLGGSPENREGVRAFLEKRKPDFRASEELDLSEEPT